MLDHQPATANFDSANLAKLREACGQAISNFDVHYAPVIDSTMNLSRWCESQGIELCDRLCVFAGKQTHGVGQHGRWVSGDNDVKLSLLLPEVKTTAEHALINCVAAFAVQRTLTELARDYAHSLSVPRFEVKLANDVLVSVDGRYRKISGSLAVGQHDSEMRELLKSRDQFIFPDKFIVLGIGINLEKGLREAKDPRFEPIALEDLTGFLIPREIAIGVLLRNLNSFLMLARSQPDIMLNALKDVLAIGKDNSVIVVTKSGEEFTARVKGLRPEGLNIDVSSTEKLIPLENIQRVIPG